MVPLVNKTIIKSRPLGSETRSGLCFNQLQVAIWYLVTGGLPNLNFVNLQTIKHLSLTFNIEAPTLARCPANQYLETNPGQLTSVAVCQDPDAVDNSRVLPKVTCDPLSGSLYPIGQTWVMCEVVDGSGNDRTCIFQINVKGWFYFVLKLVTASVLHNCRPCPLSFLAWLTLYTFGMTFLNKVSNQNPGRGA